MTALHRSPSRMSQAQRYRDRSVWVLAGRQAWQRRHLVGRLISVATMDHGTTRDVLVIRRSDRVFDESVSLAEVVSIEPLNYNRESDTLLLRCGCPVQSVIDTGGHQEGCDGRAES